MKTLKTKDRLYSLKEINELVTDIKKKILTQIDKAEKQELDWEDMYAGLRDYLKNLFDINKQKTTKRKQNDITGKYEFTISKENKYWYTANIKTPTGDFYFTQGRGKEDIFFMIADILCCVYDTRSNNWRKIKK